MGSAGGALPVLMSVSIPVPVVLFLVLLAPAVGSFLAVLVDRLPRGEDVLRRRSHCRSCGRTLRALDLLPILSFLGSAGRCRHCQAKIPPWTLYLEIAATGAMVLALAAGGGLEQVLFSALFLWLLLALGVCDLLWFRLPDVLTAVLFALVMCAALGGRPGGGLGAEIGDLTSALLGAGAGAVAGTGSFLLLRLGYRALRGREGLGLGDVKLMAGLGAYAGVFDLPLLVLLAALIGLTGGLLPLMRPLMRPLLRSPDKRGGYQQMGRPLGQQALPFGAALCAAAALLWLLRALGLLPG